jgi:hypothetical protein
MIKAFHMVFSTDKKKLAFQNRYSKILRNLLLNFEKWFVFLKGGMQGGRHALIRLTNHFREDDKVSGLYCGEKKPNQTKPNS